MALPQRPKQTDPSKVTSRPQSAKETREEVKVDAMPDFLPEASPSKVKPVQKKAPAKVAKRPARKAPPVVEKPTVEDYDGLLTQAEIDDDWAIDPKTKKKYKKLPKAQFEGEMPVLQVADFNTDDMNFEANRFLAHLRVPPDKKEMMRLRAEAAKRQAAAEKEYDEKNKGFIEDEVSEEPLD